MSIIDFKNPPRRRVWINEFPDIQHRMVDTLSTRVKVNPTLQIPSCKVALELRLLRDNSYYALLGASYIPIPGKTLDININISDFQGEIYQDAMDTFSYDRVHAGIPKDYALPVLYTAEKILLGTNEFSGKLEFICGAHSEVGSSPWIFSKATSMVIHLISQNPDHLSIESMDTLLLESFRSQLNYVEGFSRK